MICVRGRPLIISGKAQRQIHSFFPGDSFLKFIPPKWTQQDLKFFSFSLAVPRSINGSPLRLLQYDSTFSRLSYFFLNTQFYFSVYNKVVLYRSLVLIGPTTEAGARHSLNMNDIKNWSIKYLLKLMNT